MSNGSYLVFKDDVSRMYEFSRLVEAKRKAVELSSRDRLNAVRVCHNGEYVMTYIGGVVQD